MHALLQLEEWLTRLSLCRVSSLPAAPCKP